MLLLIKDTNVCYSQLDLHIIPYSADHNKVHPKFLHIHIQCVNALIGLKYRLYYGLAIKTEKSPKFYQALFL